MSTADMNIDPAYLQGLTDFGDAVDDEWLIVYLLNEISKAHPDVWIRVADTDGEFLLIEAASVLPDWLNPDIDEYRVWLHDGKLFIIPLVSISSSESLALPEALTFINHRKADLFHSPAIENEAFFRLRNYPEQIQKATHYSKVTIPRKLAYIIHEAPKSVSAAVESFYLRDAKSLKPILDDSSLQVFPPEDLITISVGFSRTLFAQLQSQQFQSPPRWARAWLALQNEQTQGFSILETGMKLSCGYEILASNVQSNPSPENHAFLTALDAVSNVRQDGLLPTDEDIRQWPEVNRHDDEGWLNINFDDLENELDGNSKARTSNETHSGFGDIKTQEDLRKMVSRFESFLSNKTAGVDGVELDTATDDEYETSSDEGSDEDADISFNQTEFSETLQSLVSSAGTAPLAGTATSNDKKIYAKDSDVQEISAQIEAELRSHGALHIEQPQKAIKVNRKGKQRMTAAAETDNDGGTSDDNSEVNVDINLARNILEGFKSQGGTSGPVGNLLGLMGFQIPRDEENDD